MSNQQLESDLEEVFGGLNERHFKYLLLSLLAIFFVLPLFHSLLVEFSPGFSRFVYLIFLFGTLMASSSIVSNKRLVFFISLLGGLVAMVLHGAFLSTQKEVYFIFNHAIISFILLHVIISLTRYLFTCKNVNLYTIYASLCSYLLMALLWALLYGLLDMAQPGAFKVPLEIDPEGRMANVGIESSFHGIYFSIVTITTLGYGDISPISSEARMLCSAEAFVGQMYIAITIARLVGIYSSESSTKAAKD